MTVRELFEEVLQVPQHRGDGVPGQSLLQVWTPQGVQNYPTEGTNPPSLHTNTHTNKYDTPPPPHTHSTDKYDTIQQNYPTEGITSTPLSLPHTHKHTDKYDTIQQDYPTQSTKPPCKHTQISLFLILYIMTILLKVLPPPPSPHSHK